MKRQAAKSRTADLFAAKEAAPRPNAHVPTPRSAGPPRLKQLWYAVVFAQLSDSESPAVLQRLCMHAQRFTSFVSVEPPNALLLEVRGSLKLFGSLERLHDDIDGCWRRLELESHSATAPSTLAALWLARAGSAPGGTAIHTEDLGALAGYLAKLPIACTAWDADRLQTLRAMGATHVGELLRLPRAGLTRRLGAATVRDLDIALARQFAPRRAFVPRERFRMNCDFEMEIETAAYLEKAVEPLMTSCARFLRERQAGVQALRLKLRHRSRPATCLHLGLASITSERRRLMDVLVQKLGKIELEAPVRGMELVSGYLQPLSAGSLDAFAGAAAGAGTGRRDGMPQLLERLRARLGEEAVYGLAPIAEHRPEAAWRRVQALPLSLAPRVNDKMPARLHLDCGPVAGMPRPVWLLDAPLPLTGALVLEEGPERIESGWWDGKGVARDYYVARQAPDAHCANALSIPGAKLWVFQERRSRRWYLHGVFA